MFRNILNLAQLFRNIVFYLPVFLDFRGRIYPLSNYLSYQSGDVSRSLLSFNVDSTDLSVGEGNNHVYIYLFNMFEGGKKGFSMDERIE